MNLFRRWHAHHEFRHHCGHGHAGHGFGRHADAGDFVDHLVARLAAKLDLDADQRGHLAAWFAQLQQQREALKGLARGPELTGLLAPEQFPQETAQQLLDAKLEAVRAAGPGVIGAFADFFDALDAEQRQALRFMTRRFSQTRRRGDGA